MTFRKLLLLLFSQNCISLYNDFYTIICSLPFDHSSMVLSKKKSQHGRCFVDQSFQVRYFLWFLLENPQNHVFIGGASSKVFSVQGSSLAHQIEIWAMVVNAHFCLIFWQKESFINDKNRIKQTCQPDCAVNQSKKQSKKFDFKPKLIQKLAIEYDSHFFFKGSRVIDFGFTVSRIHVYEL